MMTESDQSVCAKCGSKLSEDTESCGKCGTKAGDTASKGASEQQKVLAEFTDAANPYAPEPPVDPKRSRRNLIVGMVVGIVIVAVAIVVAIVIHNYIVESEGGPSWEIIQMGPAKAMEQFDRSTLRSQGNVPDRGGVTESAPDMSQTPPNQPESETQA